MSADRLPRLGTLAETVKRQDDQFLAAAEAEQEAEAELLARAIDLIRPALPAIIPIGLGCLAIGDGLVIDVAGTLFRGDRSGDPLTPMDALDNHDLGVILATLERILESHARGKKPLRTAQMLERTERLKALAALLLAIERSGSGKPLLQPGSGDRVLRERP